MAFWIQSDMPLTVRQQGRKSGARGGLQSSSQMHNICWQAKETFILCPQKRHKSCFGVILADCVPINFYNLMWVAWLKTGVYDSGSFYWLFNDISVQKLKDSQITFNFVTSTTAEILDEWQNLLCRRIRV